MLYTISGEYSNRQLLLNKCKIAAGENGYVQICIHVDRMDCSYYLEFSCPNEATYISYVLTPDHEQYITYQLPSGIFRNVGKVYVQVSLRNSIGYIAKSILSEDATFEVTESIYAGDRLQDGSAELLSELITKIDNEIEAREELARDLNAPFALDNFLDLDSAATRQDLTRVNYIRTNAVTSEDLIVGTKQGSYLVSYVYGVMTVSDLLRSKTFSRTFVDGVYQPFETKSAVSFVREMSLQPTHFLHNRAENRYECPIGMPELERMSDKTLVFFDITDQTSRIYAYTAGIKSEAVISQNRITIIANHQPLGNINVSVSII